MLKKFLVSVRDTIKYYCYVIPEYCLEKRQYPEPVVKTIDETIDQIIEEHSSISRFGDGELKWMLGIPQISFQENSVELQKKLIEVMTVPCNGHIVCLPDVFGTLTSFTPDARRYWTENLANSRRQWAVFLKSDRIYYNAFITRLYMHYQDKTSAPRYFAKIKEIWRQRDVVVVEGEKTRLGVANDLLANARSIQRILAPAVNAFSKYQELLDTVKRLEKHKLILLALGPTATVLAYDLCKSGYQALDIGHLDIEYEWMRMGAVKKVPVAGKYVNEASYCGGNIVSDRGTKEYQRQILFDLSK